MARGDLFDIDDVTLWARPRELPTIPLNATLAFDTETKDTRLLDRGPGWVFSDDDGGVVGFSIATADDQWYFPLRHPCGQNMPDTKATIRWLRDLAARTDIKWLMFNASYDLGWSAREGIHFWGMVHDASVLLALCDEYRHSYSLDAAGRDYLGSRKDFGSMEAWAKLAGIKKRKNLGAYIWQMPAAIVGAYAEQDVRLTYDLFHVLSKQADTEDLWPVYRLEMDLLPVVMAMRRRGVRVDLDAADRMRVEFKAREEEAIGALQREIGRPLDVWNIAEQVDILRAEGVSEFPRTKKVQREGLRADFLLSLAQHDNRAGRIASLLGQIRRFNKMRITFCESLVFEHQCQGRIHAEFHQLRSDEGGTVTGRLASSNPNLTNLPSPDPGKSDGGEMGRRVRGLFLPEDGERWLSNDWASQEPRLTVHYAAAAKLPGAADMVAEFHRNPRFDLHQKVRDMLEAESGISISRKKAKNLNLGITYGMGGGMICETLGLPFSTREWKGMTIKVAGPEGENVLRQHAEIAPFFRDLANMAKDVAASRGYIRTISGRVGRFPQNNGERWYLHKALNKIIQGSAADMAKRAMVACHKEGLTLLAMVHDELCFSVSDMETAKQAAKIMRESTPLCVPVVSDAEWGPNWGETEKVELD